MDDARQVDADAGMSGPENRGSCENGFKKNKLHGKMSKSREISWESHYLKINSPAARLLTGFSDHS